MGSPQYMSPEQMLSSRDVDARSDIWALGAILHELLVAVPPFAGETVAEVSAAVLRDAPPPLTSLRAEVPAAVEAVVLRCLDKDPARRFANVAELAAVLAEFGGASARASAERIARVLDGGAAQVSVRVPQVSVPEPRAEREPRTERAVSLLRRLTVPPHAGGGHILGYVVATIAFVGVGVAISWMVVKDRRAVDAAEHRQVDPSAVAASATTPAGTTTTSAATPSSATSPVAAPASANEATRQGAANEATRQGAASPPVPSAAAARPANHARWPRRGPRPQPRPPPLPDFPVPTADPAGEPSSRPIAAPPPASPALPADPSSPAPAAR